MVTINIPGRAYEYEYKGLSTDEKPADCAENSLFLELDTGKFYYFDGEAWNELGSGGGGGGGDVLYNGSITFEARTFDEQTLSVSTTPFVFTRTPDDGEDAYLYVNGSLIGEGQWVYTAPPESEAPMYKAQIMSGGDLASDIQYTNFGSWSGVMMLVDSSIVGEKTVEIRKTPRPA